VTREQKFHFSRRMTKFCCLCLYINRFMSYVPCPPFLSFITGFPPITPHLGFPSTLTYSREHKNEFLSRFLKKGTDAKRVEKEFDHQKKNDTKMVFCTSTFPFVSSVVDRAPEFENSVHPFVRMEVLLILLNKE